MAKKYNTYKKQDKTQDPEQKANAWSTMFDKLVAYAKVIEGTDWKMGWTSTKSTWHGLPQNISGRNYTGGNSFYLMMATMAQNHTVPIYATFNQIQKMNAHLMDERGRIPKEKWNEAVHVKKGEQAEIVVFNTPLYVNSERPKEKPLSAKEYDNLSKEEKEKYNQIWAHVPHVIFNIDQTNMKEVRPELYEKYVERMMPKQQQTFRQDTMGMYEEPAIDYILNNQTWRCPISFDKESRDAFYRQSTDTITLPMKQQYNIPYTEKELERDIQKYVTPAMTMQPSITDFSDADRQMLRVAGNKDNKDYLNELRATIMLENTFGKQLGMTRQEGQSINDYAKQVATAIKNDRNAIIAIKDTEAKIIGGQDYYTTFLHEGAHSMHKELNIELNATGDKKGYAREEMRVESSTAMVAAALGYSNNMFINSAAYIRGWNSAADIREKTKAMQQLVSDINKTVTRMGEIIDDARQKVGQQPVFSRSTEQPANTLSQSHTSSQTAPSQVATDVQSADHQTGNLQSSMPNNPDERSTEQSAATSSDKRQDLTQRPSQQQDAPLQQNNSDQVANTPNSSQQAEVPLQSSPSYPPVKEQAAMAVAEAPAREEQEFSLWDKLSALLMYTSEDKHLKAKEDDILVLETDEDMGLSDLEKNHLSEVWQHQTEGIITFKMEGSNQELDLSEFPEFIPQIYNHVSEGNMEMISVRQQLEDKIISLSELAADTQKVRPSDIVFVRDFDPNSLGNIYTAYGKDADRLAEKVSSSVAAIRPEIDGQRYPYATVNSGNLDAVRADLMVNNIHPVIINDAGRRVNNDTTLDYTKEERKAFMDSLKPEATQRQAILETLQKMGSPDSIAVPKSELFIPHRFGYQEIALTEVKKFKDGSYRAGNSDEGYYPISKMDTNNLYNVDQALKIAEKQQVPNLVRELQNQIQNGKAEVDRDNAGGRYIVTINDRDYERGFKQFTIGPDLKNEIFLHDDWKNRVYSIKVDPQLAQQLIAYAETKMGNQRLPSPPHIGQTADKTEQRTSQQVTNPPSQQPAADQKANTRDAKNTIDPKNPKGADSPKDLADSKVSAERIDSSQQHKVKDFSLRNVNGDWRLNATIDSHRMPEISIPKQDAVDYKMGRMSQQDLTLKSYSNLLSQGQEQTQNHSRRR